MMDGRYTCGCVTSYVQGLFCGGNSVEPLVQRIDSMLVCDGGRVGFMSMICGIVLLERAVKSGLDLRPFTVRLYFLTAVVLSVKMMQDTPIPLSVFAYIGQSRVDCLNESERYMLKLLDYNCHVSAEEFGAIWVKCTDAET